MMIKALSFLIRNLQVINKNFILTYVQNARKGSLFAGV